MDSAQLKQNIINILAIHFDRTGHEEMELAEIASHLKVSVGPVEKAVHKLVDDGMVCTTMGGRNAALLHKSYSKNHQS